MCRLLTWIFGLAALATLSQSVLARDQGPWSGTWGTSPAGIPNITRIGTWTIPPPIIIKGTIRYRLRISQGGSLIRLRISNEYGEASLVVAAVSVGLAIDGLDASPGSLKRATFDGKAGINIPAGAPALTDPIVLPVKPLSDLIVNVYVPAGLSAFVPSPEASASDPAVVDDSDATLMAHLPESKRMALRPMVSGVDVLAGHSQKVIATLGDSITDSDVDPATGERGWPGVLARRLQSAGISVVNAGISGNRLLQSMRWFGLSALCRLNQDVFSTPGVSYIIVFEGINDLRISGKGGMFGDTRLVNLEDLVAAYAQIIARAHELGIKVFGATLLPFEGDPYYSEEKESIRENVNDWIRTSNKFDGVIDFDANLRDPEHPRRLKADYDAGDHLHPSFAGQLEMGNVIDVRLFN